MHASLAESTLPGEDVGVDRVDERSIQVEDQRGHGANVLSRAAPGTYQVSKGSPAYAGAGLKATGAGTHRLDEVERTGIRARAGVDRGRPRSARRARRL